VGISVAILCVLAAGRLGFLRAFELRTVDWRLNLAHPSPPVDDFVIIAIEAATVQKLDRWGPAALQRREYVPVIRHLDEWGARSIGVDVFFAGESDAETDARLAEALSVAGNVTIVAGADTELAGRAGERCEFLAPAEPIASAAREVASPLLFRPDNVVRWVQTTQQDADGSMAYQAIARSVLHDDVGAVPARVMINWAGPAGTVAQVKFEDVHARPPDPSLPPKIRGRFVFIGVTDEVKDLFSTPMGPMSGIEIHAQAAATMLSGLYVREAPLVVGLLAALPACLAIALVGRGRRHWWTWGLSALLAAAWFGAGALAFSRSLIMLPLTGAGLGILGTGVLVSALQSETALTSLARIWPAWVSEEGEQLEVTVLVCDMAGYTARSEQSSPTEMMQMMREFFAIVDAVVEPLGGASARRPGDAALVFFRPEEGRPHHAARAVAAARELRERLDERWPEEEIGFGITLTTGEVSLGWVGESPPEPQILGDPVNVAFRLQSECRERACPIIADWETVSADEALMAQMRPLGQVEVRNRTQPVQIFAPVED